LRRPLKTADTGAAADTADTAETTEEVEESGTVRNLERAGVPRSVAMKITGHKTEAVYRRYAIVSDADLAAAAEKLTAVR
jgi:hypothetical protein